MTNVHICEARTQKGTACTRHAQEGATTCWQHTGASEPEFLGLVENKEEGMNLIHFLREVKELPGFSIRVVTNMPFKAEEEAYWASHLSHTVVPIGDSSHGLLSMDIGSQSFALFQHRAVEMGVKFRFMSVPIDAFEKYPAVADTWLARSNFAWANADNVSFIKFDGVSDWGLEPLGLVATNHKKLAKRLNEVARVAAHEYTGPITLRAFPTPVGMKDSAFDGMNIVARSFARKLGFKLDRGNIRILTGEGLIKGDFIVVPNSLIRGVDVVFHTENLKSELRTTGWTMATCAAHAPIHELRHDDQTRANFSDFITPSRVLSDLKAMEEAFTTSVEEGGDLAEYLQGQQRPFDNPFPVEYNRFDTAQRIEEMAGLLKEIGVAPASFANIPFIRLNALKNKMNANRFYIQRPESEGGQVISTDFFNRMAIPASNALDGAVVTYEACHMMGGVEFTQSDGSMTFFDSRFGIVMPADRFEATYDLHGGWDLDDSVSLLLIKVFCTDGDRLRQLVSSGVLDPQIVVPENKSYAIEVGLMIRRPNGPGEYSIEAIDASAIPWIHYNADTVEVVDLAHAPYDQKSVFAQSVIGEVHTSLTYDMAYDRRVAGEVIAAQMQNPTVGGFANVLMAWTDTFGVGTIPAEIIGCMEDVVDAVQQTSDILSFQEIRAEVERLWLEFANQAILTGTPVDRALWLTRVPENVGPKKPVGTAILAAGLIHDGPNTLLHKEYAGVIDTIGNLALYTAAATRAKTPLAIRIRQEKFGQKYLVEARNLYTAINKGLKQIDNKFNAEAKHTVKNAVARRRQQTARRLTTEAFMDKVVSSVFGRTNTDPERLMLALYKFIVTPDANWKNGKIDRAFVQPSSPESTGMMELFIRSLEHSGILADIKAMN